MTDEPHPFPAAELAELMRAADDFGSAARDWLQWATEVEAGASAQRPDLYRVLLDFRVPVPGQAMPAFLDELFATMDATEIDAEAAVISALALRAIVRRFEIDAEDST